MEVPPSPTCQQQIETCDHAIEAHVHQLNAELASPGPLPEARTRRKPSAGPAFDVRTTLHHLTGGIDLTQIDGIAPYTALKLVADIGTDMRRWPSAQHFTSWLTLAPKNKVSGGKLLHSQTQPSANRAALAFRLAAAALGRTQTAWGRSIVASPLAWGNRRRGPPPPASWPVRSRAPAQVCAPASPRRGGPPPRCRRW
jgi:transposase